MHIAHRSARTMDAGSLVHANFPTECTSCARHDRRWLCPIDPEPHKGLFPIWCDYSGRNCSHCSIRWCTRWWPPDQGDHRLDWKPLELLLSWNRAPWTYQALTPEESGSRISNLFRDEARLKPLVAQGLHPCSPLLRKRHVHRQRYL